MDAPTGTKVRLLAAVVAVVGAGAYANTLANGFVMDDRYNVVENAAIQRLDNIPSFFVKPLGHAARGQLDRKINRAYWRPLTLVSYALDYQIWQLRPLGYHLTNVLLHAAISALLLWLFVALGMSLAAASAAALVFALHPVHTEVVNLITYRTELLAAGFVVAALLLHARGGRGLPHDLLLLPLLYACGLACKETAVTLPGWLLLLDLARGGASRTADPGATQGGGAEPSASGLPRLAVRYLALAGVLGGYLLLRRSLLGHSGIDFFAELPFDLRLLSVAKIYRHYVQLLVFPWPLISFYDWTVLPPASGWGDWRALAGLALGVVTPLAAALLWTRVRLAAVGLLWWAVGLLPVVHLVALPVGAAERFLYLPSIGICLALGGALDRLWRGSAVGRGLRLRGALPWLLPGAAILVLMALGTVVRNGHWRSDLTLQRRAALDYPGSFSAHYNLGKLHLAQGSIPQAIDALARADAILPNIPANVVRLADALITACQHERAAGLLDRAMAENGQLPQLRQLRAAALERRCGPAPAGAARR